MKLVNKGCIFTSAIKRKTKKIEIMKTTKIQSGNYKVYNNNVFVGSIDKLENNEWVCYDVQGRAFEIAYSKKGALTKYN